MSAIKQKNRTRGLFGAVLAAAVAITAVLPAAAAEQKDESNTMLLWGTVTRQENGSLLMNNSNPNVAQQEIILNVSDQTVILNAVDGASQAPADLKDNETVYAYTSKATAMSMPPQTSAELILCQIPADYKVPAYYEITKAAKAADGKAVTLETTVGETLEIADSCKLEAYLVDKIPVLDDLAAGGKVLVWTDDGNKATKALLFPAAKTAEVTDTAEQAPATEAATEAAAPSDTADSSAATGTASSGMTADAALAQDLLSTVNAARTEAGKAALAGDATLDKAALAYAEALNGAGASYRSTTDFSSLPDGARVYSLLQANGYTGPVNNFNYSVWQTEAGGSEALANHAAYVKTTPLLNTSAVQGDYAKVGIACATSGSYSVVIMLFHS